MERQRQRQLLYAGMIPWACEDPDTDNGYKLVVLTEELGEVARAILDGGNLKEELVQVAAVAVAWAESLSGNGS